MHWESGFVCPQCGGHHHTAATAGTLLHKGHVPPTKWFLVFYFVCQDKRGISAVQLSFRIGVTGKTAWRMLDLIRTAAA